MCHKGFDVSVLCGPAAAQSGDTEITRECVCKDKSMLMPRQRLQQRLDFHGSELVFILLLNNDIVQNKQYNTKCT